MRTKNFVVCGMTGLCIEVFFTSLCAAGKKDKKLMGQSSAWMFPIYGLASIIGDIYPKIAGWPKLVRAFLYGISIMVVEYASGYLLSLLNVCPWNYEGCRYSVKGLIRLDFLPLWMIAGIFYENLLKNQSKIVCFG